MQNIKTTNVYNMLPCRCMPVDMNINGEHPAPQRSTSMCYPNSTTATRQVPLLLRGFGEHDCSIWFRLGWKKFAREQVNQAQLPWHQHRANLSQTYVSINNMGVAFKNLTNRGLVFLGQCFDKRGYPRMEVGSALRMAAIEAAM